MLSGKKIIVGVTGSIAAYKAALLVRLLVKNGAEVKVVTTGAANEFISELTLSNLSQHPVFSDLWSGTWAEHVHLGTWADLMIVAPCTANTLGKMAHGICDNALTAVYLSARCPVVIAPAMDADMYIHPTTSENLARLTSFGNVIVPAEKGFLASGLEGQGRMAEPETILQKATEQLQDGPLTGKKILITAGPTVEAIDPVRFISNRSTGTMGYQLAAAAHALGAEVTLISGPVNPKVALPFSPLRIESAQELYDAVHEHFAKQDIVIMAAAVADYTPVEKADHKIKKKEGDLSIELGRTKDILKSLGEIKGSAQILTGFALETQNGIENAQRKLKKKNLDYIVLNIQGEKGAGFGTSTNKIAILDKKGQISRYPVKDKAAVAHDILNRIITDQGYEQK